MKQGGPSPLPEPQSAPPTIEAYPAAPATEPKPAQRVPPPSSEPAYTEPSMKERSTRETNGRYAEPEFQDGRYGFESREEKMDVDMEEKRELVRDNRRIDRYSARRDGRPGYGRGYQRDDRRDRDSYGRENGRPYGGVAAPEPKRLYSDDLYSNQRGRGFR